MEKKTDLILVGKQGCGKGTQAKILAEKFGYKIFETGGALRAIAKEDSDLGREVLDITTRGDLVPNEIVMRLVEDFIKKIDGVSPVIFDGIPRSEDQKQALEALLVEMQREFRALEINISDTEGVARLSIRAKCEDCGANFGSKDDACPDCDSTNISRREDDNPESIQNRLNIYREKTAPLLADWEAQGKLVSVNGEQSVDEVTAEMIEKLGL